MARGSFEDSVLNKLKEVPQKAPKRVWSAIDAVLNEQALEQYRASQAKYRWAAAAAILVAFFSLALHLNLRLDENSIEKASYNALLPNSSGHFRFYQPSVAVPGRSTDKVWSNVVFVRTREQQRKVASASTYSEVLREKTPVFELDAVTPDITVAMVEDGYVSHYLVPQVRGGGKGQSKSATRFWAGLEAGAGNFNPEFQSTDPIAATANFDAIANQIGQNGFVNPSSTAAQNSMNQGVVTSLGVDVGLKMGRKWTLESGVQYASVNNSSSAEVFITDIYTVSNTITDGDSPLAAPSARETTIRENISHEVDLENTIRFTSVPLKAGYFLMDRRLSLRVNAGITANYFLGSQLSDPTGQLLGPNDTGFYNDWSFDGLTGLEIGYSIFDNFNLTVEPNYIQSITPISANMTSRNGVLVQTGLRYIVQ